MEWMRTQLSKIGIMKPEDCNDHWYDAQEMQSLSDSGIENANETSSTMPSLQGQLYVSSPTMEQVSSVVIGMIETVSKGESSSVLDDVNKKELFTLDYGTDIEEFRLPRTRNMRSMSASSISEISSDSDSTDEEIERILATPLTKEPEVVEDTDDEDDLQVKSSVKMEHEYDNLPGFEQLSIHVDEDIPLQQLGSIYNVVDRLVVIEADSEIALDCDTVLFDSDRNAIGQVFDVFGPVVKPMYAILFNTVKEANELKIGSPVYYAPSAQLLTHNIYTDVLKNEKSVDSCWDGQGECPEDLLSFSDDESEMRHRAKARAKFDTREGSSGEKKRARRTFGSRSRGAGINNSINAKFQAPPLRFPNLQWPPVPQTPCAVYGPPTSRMQWMTLCRPLAPVVPAFIAGQALPLWRPSPLLPRPGIPRMMALSRLTVPVNMADQNPRKPKPSEF